MVILFNYGCYWVIKVFASCIKVVAEKKIHENRLSNIVVVNQLQFNLMHGKGVLCYRKDAVSHGYGHFVAAPSKVTELAMRKKGIIQVLA